MLSNFDSQIQMDLADAGADPLIKNLEGHAAGNGISGDELAVPYVWETSGATDEFGDAGGDHGEFNMEA